MKMNEKKRRQTEKVCLLFMMDGVYITAGDRCVEGCAFHKPSGGVVDPKELTIKTEPEKRNPLRDSSLYAKHLSLCFMFHIRF